jgi:hypothetical protein
MSLFKIMEIVEIKIKRSNFPRLMQLLEKLDFLESFQIKKSDLDEVSMVAEKSLAEEWDSDEDARWDEIL